MTVKKLFVSTLAASLLVPATTSIAQQKMDEMKGMDLGKKQAAATTVTHKTVALVKKVDVKGGKVTLDHEPVQSLNWPAMTMGFTVTDKKLLDKLTEGKKVEVEFERAGKDYVITSVK